MPKSNVKFFFSSGSTINVDGYSDVPYAGAMGGTIRIKGDRVRTRVQTDNVRTMDR